MNTFSFSIQTWGAAVLLMMMVLTSFGAMALGAQAQTSAEDTAVSTSVEDTTTRELLLQQITLLQRLLELLTERYQTVSSGSGAGSEGGSTVVPTNTGTPGATTNDSATDTASDVALPSTSCVGASCDYELRRDSGSTLVYSNRSTNRDFAERHCNYVIGKIPGIDYECVWEGTVFRVVEVGDDYVSPFTVDDSGTDDTPVEILTDDSGTDDGEDDTGNDTSDDNVTIGGSASCSMRDLWTDSGLLVNNGRDREVLYGAEASVSTINPTNQNTSHYWLSITALTIDYECNNGDWEPVSGSEGSERFQQSFSYSVSDSQQGNDSAIRNTLEGLLYFDMEGEFDVTVPERDFEVSVEL